MVMLDDDLIVVARAKMEMELLLTSELMQEDANMRDSLEQPPTHFVTAVAVVDTYINDELADCRRSFGRILQSAERARTPYTRVSGEAPAFAPCRPARSVCVPTLSQCVLEHAIPPPGGAPPPPVRQVCVGHIYFCLARVLGVPRDVPV